MNSESSGRSTSSASAHSTERHPTPQLVGEEQRASSQALPSSHSVVRPSRLPHPALVSIVTSQATAYYSARSHLPHAPTIVSDHRDVTENGAKKRRLKSRRGGPEGRWIGDAESWGMHYDPAHSDQDTTEGDDDSEEEELSESVANSEFDPETSGEEVDRSPRRTSRRAPRRGGSKAFDHGVEVSDGADGDAGSGLDSSADDAVDGSRSQPRPNKRRKGKSPLRSRESSASASDASDDVDAPKRKSAKSKRKDEPRTRSDPTQASVERLARMNAKRGFGKRSAFDRFEISAALVAATYLSVLSEKRSKRAFALSSSSPYVPAAKAKGVLRNHLGLNRLAMSSGTASSLSHDQDAELSGDPARTQPASSTSGTATAAPAVVTVPVGAAGRPSQEEPLQRPKFEDFVTHKASDAAPFDWPRHSERAFADFQRQLKSYDIERLNRQSRNRHKRERREQDQSRKAQEQAQQNGQDENGEHA
ncbi:hypothetical protein IE81DRAFT_346330 [Ceraceosorus guamensis]|uniref:Uncharacterized protein n=1 Tax=Ceraceosorus guamensis TaxID=1522189 RepID=A0A316W4Y5_9BASI|nr:hypothetical protein IE81DRAFT_346330 [Ceraceosorus guamensis]PWN43731.1 hypothetical protein IE81DRAFT_346330 [Ceraceosorus guamensis]